METVRDIVFLVKSPGFKWKTYHEDESGVFASAPNEVHVLLNNNSEVPSLTEKMIKTIEAIRSKKPNSIKELSGVLSEDYGNTHRLCTEMQKYGFVDLLPQSDKPKSKLKPVVNYNHLSLTTLSTDALIAKRMQKKKSA